MSGAEKILLVEDDDRLASLICEYLLQHGFEVDVEPRGDAASDRILDTRPALVILDLMLPGRDGFDICRDVRPFFSGPILMLTARDDDIDQVVGLELGADDYVNKPVEPRVLLARMRALLRRYAKTEGVTSAEQRSVDRDELIFGALRISRGRREVTLKGHSVELTTTEFELLWLLADAAGTILSREETLAALRGIDYDGLDRSVDNCISRLRKKLGDSRANPTRIKTVRSKGYLFVADAW
ncbi:MAG: winged helix-turn-helix domain-containing protein [Geminicoccaceae bacterium]